MLRITQLWEKFIFCYALEKKIDGKSSSHGGDFGPQCEMIFKKEAFKKYRENNHTDFLQTYNDLKLFQKWYNL